MSRNKLHLSPLLFTFWISMKIYICPFFDNTLWILLCLCPISINYYFFFWVGYNKWEMLLQFPCDSRFNPYSTQIFALSVWFNTCILRSSPIVKLWAFGWQWSVLSYHCLHFTFNAIMSSLFRAHEFVCVCVCWSIYAHYRFKTNGVPSWI